MPGDRDLLSLPEWRFFHRGRSSCGGFGLQVFAELGEPVGGEVLPVEDDGGDAAGVADVFEWIAVEQNQVGELAGSDAAEVGAAMEEERGVERGGLQRLQRREAGRDEALEFAVRLMPGMTSTPAGVSVPARNGTPAS